MTSHIPKKHIPSFATLRSFESAARHESFTLAADELHLTQSAISRQVKELELSMGVNLFRRVGRHVVLTNAGKKFADDVSVDLERVRQTLARAILAGDKSTVLRIATMPTFASRWLIPKLPNFLESHPDIELSMAARMEPFNLSAGRFDLAIHYGKANWPDAQMTKICSEELFAVASPDFKEKYKIESLEELQNVPLLHLASRPQAWNTWFKNNGSVDKHVYPGKSFDQYSMIIAATVSSMGAALLPAYLIEKEVECGNLIQLSTTPFVTNNSYYVVTPAGVSNLHIQSFVHWIKAEAVNSRKLRLQ